MLLRIGLILFCAELAIMTWLPEVLTGVDQWAATMVDSLLLTLVATPLINWLVHARWRSQVVPPQIGHGETRGWGKIAESGWFSGFVEVGLKVALVVFAVESGIMLLLPLMEFPFKWEGILDAVVVTVVGTPLIGFMIVVRPDNFDTMKGLRRREFWRRFMVWFLGMVTILVALTVTVYFLEIKNGHAALNSAAGNHLHTISSAVGGELGAASKDLLTLVRQSELHEFLEGHTGAKGLLQRDLMNFLAVKQQYEQVLLTDPQGNLLLGVAFDGNRSRVLGQAELNARFMPEDFINAVSVPMGEIHICPMELMTRNGKVVTPEVPLMHFSSRVFGPSGELEGVVILTYLGNWLLEYLDTLSSHLPGRVMLVDDIGNWLFGAPDSLVAAGKWGNTLNRERGVVFSRLYPRVWSQMIARQRGRLSNSDGDFLFTTIHYEAGAQAANSLLNSSSTSVNSSSHVHHQHAPMWKLVINLPIGIAQQEYPELRSNLLLLLSTLMGVAAFGSWLLAVTITTRKEVEARNLRAYQSRITISALLETGLSQMSLDEQLRVVLQVIQSTPWLRFGGSGAIFLADDDLKRLDLKSSNGLSDEGAHQVCSRVPYGHCICGQVAVQRRLTYSAVDDSLHHLTHPGGDPVGHYCIPIQNGSRLLGVMSLFMDDGFDGNQEVEAFLVTVASTVATIIERRIMEEDLQRKNSELVTTRQDIIHRLGMAAEYRDSDTGQHVVRMSRYAAALARAAGLSAPECEVILNAAPMHDVGKIGIRDEILLKPGRLTPEEYEVMKTHTLIGSYMLHGYDSEPMNTAHIIALTHHERWDGTGYPIGVPGEEIPLEGRICAIADVFDALTTDRPYKRAWPITDAVEEIKRGSGRAFDPRLVELFCGILPEIVAISEACQDG